MKTASIDRTVAVYEFIRHCPNRKAKIEFVKIKKDLVQATAALARRKNTSLEKGNHKKGEKRICEARATRGIKDEDNDDE